MVIPCYNLASKGRKPCFLPLAELVTEAIIMESVLGALWATAVSGLQASVEHRTIRVPRPHNAPHNYVYGGNLCPNGRAR